MGKVQFKKQNLIIDRKRSRSALWNALGLGRVFILVINRLIGKPPDNVWLTNCWQSNAPTKLSCHGTRFYVQSLLTKTLFDSVWTLLTSHPLFDFLSNWSILAMLIKRALQADCWIILLEWARCGFAHRQTASLLPSNFDLFCCTIANLSLCFATLLPSLGVIVMIALYRFITGWYHSIMALSVIDCY